MDDLKTEVGKSKRLDDQETEDDNMKLLVYGSLNIDTVLKVNHFVRAGETLHADSVNLFPGGKGLNQAIAAARGGAPVSMAGQVGRDGGFLIDLLQQDGVDSRFVRQTDGLTGSALIQVEPDGQNCIIIAGNANVGQTTETIAETLAGFAAGDIILLQNEINRLADIIGQAADQGMRIYLNPSPFTESLRQCPLAKVAGFILNETEGAQMTGETEPDRILDAMQRQYPAAETLLTLGAQGSCYQNGNLRLYQSAFAVKPIDTTGAGDTFTGYYLAGLARGEAPQYAIRQAAKAAALAVGRPGAASSIPLLQEVLDAELTELATEG